MLYLTILTCSTLLICCGLEDLKKPHCGLPYVVTLAFQVAFLRLWKYYNSILNKMNCELMLTYDTPALWQTGSGIWWVQKRFPRYGVPIWSLWPNIRFLPSIVAAENATKNEHICSTWRKINKVGKQEVGIWRVQKRFPQYGIPIWSLWPIIGFLSSIVAEKNATKNVHIQMYVKRV